MALIKYITDVEIAFGAIEKLPEACRASGMTKPLIVTDAGVKAAGILATAVQAMGDMPHAIYDGTPSNPTEAAVREATVIYKQSGCDGLIALGGGSSMDCAKGAAITVSHEGPLKTYATIEGGSPKITAKVAPLIAVPTTAGTGSEVARGAIVIVDDGRKLGFHSWSLVPKMAICDPALTVGLPSGLTAATGMDAIAHCMETFMAAPYNPPADGIALDGLTRGWANIQTATEDGSNQTARLEMMSASMQGAMAFQKGLGCVHSLSHSLGGLNPRLHHGTLNAMFLPAVIRFNGKADSVRNQRRMQRMAYAMGFGDIEDADSATNTVANAVTNMNQRLKLPSGLGEMGVTEADFAAVIKGAMADHCHGTNPRIATEEDYRVMLLAAM